MRVGGWFRPVVSGDVDLLCRGSVLGIRIVKVSDFLAGFPNAPSVGAALRRSTLLVDPAIM